MSNIRSVAAQPEPGLGCGFEQLQWPRLRRAAPQAARRVWLSWLSCFTLSAMACFASGLVSQAAKARLLGSVFFLNMNFFEAQKDQNAG